METITPGKPDIHQRVAERIVCEGFDEIDHLSTSLTAAILEEEYGPIIKAAREALLWKSDELRAALSKKGLL